MVTVGGGDPSTVNLLAYLEGQVLPSDVDRMVAFVKTLEPGALLPEPPVLVNEGEGLERTIGVLLVLPQVSEDPWLEERALQEVVRVVEAFEAWTLGTDDVVAWELDGTVVGWVEEGRRDSLMDSGFIGPWRHQIGSAGDEGPSSATT